MKQTVNLGILFLLIAAFSITACQQSASADDMAADLCECMRPMAESFKAIESLSAAGEVDALEDAMESLDATTQAADECTADLEEKYGDALEEQETKIKELMVEKCPEVARAMQEAEAAF